MEKTRKIHSAIWDTYCDLRMSQVKSNVVRLNSKLFMEKAPLTFTKHDKTEVQTAVIKLVYCGRTICSRTLPSAPLENDWTMQIVKQPLWTSQTAMGYYRAFFDRDDIRVVKGEFTAPDCIQVVPA